MAQAAVGPRIEIWDAKPANAANLPDREPQLIDYILTRSKSGAKET
ncbi:MAG: hypothetical protein HYY25_01115 [Candidatus Wallbacteria bacterium]|nr:hypothetical protein [Candidatus Wallbacteria bacterium]